jgi:hypothetical protein
MGINERAFMMNHRSKHCVAEPTTKNHSYFLLLSLLRAVIEKHGGHMEIDEINNTFTVIISENRKAACLQELEEIIGPYEPVSESSFPVH